MFCPANVCLVLLLEDNVRAPPMFGCSLVQQEVAVTDELKGSDNSESKLGDFSSGLGRLINMAEMKPE